MLRKRPLSRPHTSSISSKSNSLTCGGREPIRFPAHRFPQLANLDVIDYNASMFSGPGRVLIIVGLALIAVGLLLNYTPLLSALGLGRLPGDIRYRRGGLSFFFPLTTCIILSILLSLILYIFRK